MYTQLIPREINGDQFTHHAIFGPRDVAEISTENMQTECRKTSGQDQNPTLAARQQWTILYLIFVGIIISISKITQF